MRLFQSSNAGNFLRFPQELYFVLRNLYEIHVNFLRSKRNAMEMAWLLG